MNIGYQKLRGDYIAKLEILGETDENRQDIADPQYAKYHTSKAKVLKIFHMNGEVNGETQVNDETRVIKQMNGLYDTNFVVYIEGKEYVFDYFKTPYQAKMRDLSSDNYTGKWIEWYDNGNKKEGGEFKDGEKEGKWTGWYNDGTVRYEGEFKDGKAEGKWSGWYSGNNKWYEGEFKDGKEEGKWIEWRGEWCGGGNKIYEYKNGNLIRIFCDCCTHTV